MTPNQMPKTAAPIKVKAKKVRPAKPETALAYALRKAGDA